MSLCRYSHGNLTQSELMGKDEHYQLQERVEQRSVAAVQTALRARRVAASIQVRPPQSRMLPDACVNADADAALVCMLSGVGASCA